MLTSKNRIRIRQVIKPIGDILIYVINLLNYVIGI